MNVPVRPAPAPPAKNRPNPADFFGWGDGNDVFFGNQQTAVQTQQVQNAKRKPPPRPPPPKFDHKKQQKQVSSRGRLASLFNKSQRTNVIDRTKQSNQKNHPSSVSMGNCRPYSPSPTSRSSSDGVSVNSFGSDGSFSNNTVSGGTASIFESGFEEDFDLWISTPTKSHAIEQNDPWKSTQPDPFSPPPQPQQQIVHSASFPAQKANTHTSWFEELSKLPPPAPSTLKSTPLYGSVPTIIRPKPNRPPQASKCIQNGALERNTGSQSLQNTFSSMSLLDMPLKPVTQEIEQTSDFDDQDDWEPPMPSVPPPPPPPEVMEELSKMAPPVPPKPHTSQVESKPYGIAIYDYDSSHPDDLAFKVNDVIFLKRRVNNEWLLGQLGQKEGMFPSNFIDVIVPLKEENHCKVKTLYAFTGETPTDLEFPEGASVNVISRISADWLYGEYNGKKGQFPALYVDNIPSGLPDYCDL